MALKRVSLWAMIIALAAESGAKNVALSALVTFGTPAASAGFVYEVLQMRRATLEREAKDRSSRATRAAGSDVARASPDDADETGASQDGMPVESLEHRLAVMLMSRRQMLDIYGDARQALPPVYQKIVQGMLVADTQIFDEIEAGRKKNANGSEAALKSGQDRLRVVHQQLTELLARQGPSHQANRDVLLR